MRFVVFGVSVLFEHFRSERLCAEIRKLALRRQKLAKPIGKLAVSILWKSAYRRLTPQEARRLARQRERLDRTRKRFYANDGRLTYKERRKLQQKYYQYRRDVRRDRRDW